MFVFLGVMFGGVLCGYLIRRRRRLLTWVARGMMPVVGLLLFLMGVTVGRDPTVINNLTAFGAEALVITLGALIGSVLLAWIVFRLFFRKPAEDESSLVLILFFVGGILCGRFGGDQFCRIGEDAPLYALGLLMAMVGIGIGGDRTVLFALREHRYRLLLLPLGTLTGTLLGVALVCPFLSGHSLSDCLMVGSGFGYYSLSSILITGSRGIGLGTVALISNILRELFTLLFTPLLIRVAGPLAPIAAGGATTADTSLPVIARFSGKEFIFVSVVHGIVLDFSVPFLMAFFSVFDL